VIWLLDPEQRLDLPGETPCVAAPESLENPSQLSSVHAIGKGRFLIKWWVNGCPADSKRRPETLATTAADRVIVLLGSRWALLTREARPS